MTTLATQAQLEKLAGILATDTDSVAFLAHLDAGDLRALREGISDALFARFRDSFRGFARLASYLPAALSARLAEHVLGPTLAGRIAGEMPPDKAIALAERLPDAFLADTCLQLDPQRADAIIAGFPIARAVTLTGLLLTRGEYITMGRFVDVLPSETMFAATDAIDNESDLLQISFYVEDSGQLDRVVAHLSPSRRRGLIRAAAEHNRWAEVIATVQRISLRSRVALATAALGENAQILDSLIRAAALRDLWPALLSMGEDIEHDARARLMQQNAFNDPMIVRSVMTSVASNNLWGAFTRQFEAMGERGTARMLQMAARRQPAFLAELGRELEHASENVRAHVSAAGQLLGHNSRRLMIQACDNTALARLLEKS